MKYPEEYCDRRKLFANGKKRRRRRRSRPRRSPHNIFWDPVATSLYTVWEWEEECIWEPPVLGVLVVFDDYEDEVGLEEIRFLFDPSPIDPDSHEALLELIEYFGEEVVWSSKPDVDMTPWYSLWNREHELMLEAYRASEEEEERSR